MEDTYFPQRDDIIDVVTADFYPEKKTNQRGIRTWNDLDLARRAL
jgi:2-oxoisovalerate dehydrogenase E1 component